MKPEKTEQAGITTEIETPDKDDELLKKQRKFKRNLRELIIKIAALVVGIEILTNVVFGVHVIHDNNMFPSLRDGDLVITYRLVGRKAADHVFAYRFEGKTYFGRIVGVPGDVIDVRDDGHYTINGNNPYEDRFYETMPSGEGNVTYPYTVPEDCVFLLADYRVSLQDSRTFGAIPIKDLRGEAVLSLRRRGF